MSKRKEVVVEAQDEANEQTSAPETKYETVTLEDREQEQPAEQEEQPADMEHLPSYQPKVSRHIKVAQGHLSKQLGALILKRDDLNTQIQSLIQALEALG
jgi:hypothetical protein